MVRSYSMALFVVKCSDEAMARNQLDLAITIAGDTKEESIIATLGGTIATALVGENFVFKVSSEVEGNPKMRVIVSFLSTGLANFVKIVNSLSDYLYSY